MRAVQIKKHILSTATLLVSIIFLFTIAVQKLSSNNELERQKKQSEESDSFKIYNDATTMRSRAASVATLRKKIYKDGIYQRDQQLEGSLVDSRPKGIVSTISSNITTEMVFAFSPEVEEKFKDKIVDPNHEQKVFANSPAMIWDGEKFVVVMRMWLDKEHMSKNTMNIFSDNYLYTRTYDDKMQPLDVSGKVLGIPTRVFESIGKQSYYNLYFTFSYSVFKNDGEI